MLKQTILTDEGLRALETELEYLKTVSRKEIAEKIKVALSFGDLSENSEYDEAKSEQGKLESRISEIEQMLQNATVLNEDELSTDKITVGSRVRVRDIEFNEELSYQIVGFAEASPDDGRISDESPVGKALLTHRVGDTVTVEAPAGNFSFEILEITK